MATEHVCCPNCRRMLEIPAGSAIARIRCPDCGCNFQLPPGMKGAASVRWQRFVKGSLVFLGLAGLGVLSLLGYTLRHQPHGAQDTPALQRSTEENAEGLAGVSFYRHTPTADGFSALFPAEPKVLTLRLGAYGNVHSHAATVEKDGAIYSVNVTRLRGEAKSDSENDPVAFSRIALKQKLQTLGSADSIKTHETILGGTKALGFEYSLRMHDVLLSVRGASVLRENTHYEVTVKHVLERPQPARNKFATMLQSFRFADPSRIDEFTLFLKAIEAGNDEKTRDMLRGRPQFLSRRSYGGDTPLHIAVDAGHINVVRVLLAAGANPDAKNDAHYTPLHRAAQSAKANGDPDIVSLLIAREADVNARSRWGLVPLHFVARRGHIAVARVLIAHGADVNAKSQHTGTPLAEAIKHNRTTVATLLQEHDGRAKN